MMHLTDDGTLDTVIRCSECGEEMRFNFDPTFHDDEDGEPDYDAYVDECIEQATEDHTCIRNVSEGDL